ncbi:alanine acetyltransferase [Virgibacillus phasianinus]|uniref:Alanine acetyltransferase n=1 Tax=Virgibacillus phasianinus TaxID=2017483 RepID=A0A220U1S8_9BACI|nr:GNAT family N-acetyltransferase [Virgibacillus phasianinus]ASK61886.1 alanine acetyltransferase [Virgibacillus phasianinus]
MLIGNVFTEIPILETEHYILKGLKINDTAELFAFMHDKETMKYITPHPVCTIDEMKDKVHGQLKRYEWRKEIPWVIVNKSNEELIGQFSLHKLNMWHKKAEMGVTIKKEYQAKGVMTEILEQILAFGFETLGLNRIVGDIFAGNMGSEKLLRNYGFMKEGVLRQTDFDGENYHDTVVYSMMKEEYKGSLKA